MDKAVLRNFAIESRKDLMEKIDRKIKLFYIDEEFKKDNRGDVIVLSNDKHTLTLTQKEDSDREKLIKRIAELGYEQVVEEAAYTWFNRLIAIRYMEINDYLPLTKDNQSLGIRVLSSNENTTNPEILKFSTLTNSEIDINFNKNYYSELKDENDKFKYVLLLVCHKLGEVIPQVFNGLTDYIDILIPDNLLSDTGFVSKLINTVTEDNFKQVEIIGWLYQYYNQVEKDRVISSKKAYKKNEIAYATQLFTPDWIVKYMVENSLGKYWIEHSDDTETQKDWKYFVNNNIYKKNNQDPSSIKFIDPCCGSGHILVYAFELFYKMYMQAGYSKNSIPELILKNNLYGLEIDNRAGQLSILSVLLKAREYDKNIFNKNIANDLNIYSIQESNTISQYSIDNISNKDALEQAKYLYDKFINAKEIGSLITTELNDYNALEEYIDNENTIFGIELREKLLPIVKVARVLSKKYNIVVTNPPYMNTTSMSANLKDYVNEHYNDYKYDLFSAFIIRNSNFADEDGLMGFMTPYVWMFISSYEKLRNYIINNLNISSLIQFEYSALEEATVPICSFVLNKNIGEIGNYFRLTDYRGGMTIQEEKYLEINAKKGKDYYSTKVDSFKKIPGSPIVYWASNQYFEIFKNSKILKNDGDTRQGMATSDNNRFLRYWYEVNNNKIGFDMKDAIEAENSRKKWFPYNKGGYFRKWYGNMDFVINYENDGFEVKEYAKSLYNSVTRTIKSISEYFKPSISWSKISSGSIAFRYYPNGFIFDVAGCCIFYSDEKKMFYQNAFLNTKVASSILGMISPTLNYEAGHIAILPIIENNNYLDKIISLVKENISLSKTDWDSFETSWDFKVHPLIRYSKLNSSDCKIKDAFESWNKECDERFNTLKSNEEELNKIFIDIYGLDNELSYNVEEKDITIRKADKEREIKSLISYGIGCIFGRYSLDEDGIFYAGGIYEKDKYKKYIPDDDNIVPFSDNEDVYYNDDIVGKFKEFIKVAFGEKNLNENLNYIAEVLGKRGTESSDDTIRRYFVNDFYIDHIKIYQKRPIYWMFDSGKKNGFKCLVYLHRYNEQIVSKIRTKYLHNTISIYQRTLEEIDFKLNNDNLNTIDKRDLQNKKSDLNAKISECNEYEEKIGNVANKMIKLDLDDGIVNNYAKLIDDNGKSVLAKIK